jgi:uncharacterized protein with PIN domain
LILLDAYALVALIADEPAAGEVEEFLRAGECGVVVANLAEAVDICSRVHGLDQRVIRQALDPILGDSLEVVLSTESEAWQAATLRSAHYDKRSSALSLADCLLLAHATLSGDAIVTADPPLAQTARHEGIDVKPLPDSSGTRP